MDSLTLWLLTTFDFFASGLGILTIGAVAIGVLLLWEWRARLLGLCVIQLGVVVVVTRLHEVNVEWAQVQLLVLSLCVAMLALSARQIPFALPYQRPGSWFVRIMAVVLLLISWRIFKFDELPLPIISPALAQIFLWLGVCALIMLGLGDAPLSTGIALLLWFIPIQAFIQILLPDFRLFVLIGMIQILSALACSYLMLAARQPATATVSASTDIVFPMPTSSPRALPPPPERLLQPPRLLSNGGRQQMPPLRAEDPRGEAPVAPRKAL